MGYREDKAYVKVDAFFTVIFSIACLIGGTLTLFNVAFTPPSLESAGNQVTHVLWSATLTAGSLMVIVGRLSGRIKVEAAGALGIAVGAGIYVSALITFVLTESRPGSITAAAFFLSLTLGFGYRAYVLNSVGKGGGGPDDARLLGIGIPD